MEDIADFCFFDSLNKVDGILKFQVELNDLIVKVKYDTKKISQEEIELAISNAGYQANAIDANVEAYNKLAMCCKLPEDRK